MSGRLADKVYKQGQGCLEGYQTRFTDKDKGVWKVSRREQGCLDGKTLIRTGVALFCAKLLQIQSDNFVC